MLERPTNFLGMTKVASKVALRAGSSQHGKHLRADVDSNWVTAAYRSSPLAVVYLVKKIS